MKPLFMVAALLVMAAFLGAASAVTLEQGCDPACGAGEVCQVTGQDCVPICTGYETICDEYQTVCDSSHQECVASHEVCGWGPWEPWKCPGNHDTETCHQDYDHHTHVWSHTHYSCKTICDEYITVCDVSHEECVASHEACTGYEDRCTDIYGCVAVTCPAVPCPEGEECVDGSCVTVPPVDPCVDVQCREGLVCVEGSCVDQNPEEPETPAPGLAPFTDQIWGTVQPAGPGCESLEGLGPAIPLESYDDEPLFVTITHNGQFSAEVITHLSEIEDMYAKECKARAYYRGDCAVQRIGGVSGVISFTITGTRDFRVVAAPDSTGDKEPMGITITNHAVDYSGTTGRTLDLHFVRTMDLRGCRYWSGGYALFSGI